MVERREAGYGVEQRRGRGKVAHRAAQRGDDLDLNGPAVGGRGYKMRKAVSRERWRWEERMCVIPVRWECL